MSDGTDSSGGTDVTRVVSAQFEAPDEVEATPAVRIGHKLDRYVILEVLGSGGMGDVHLAWDPELDRRVAIKVLRSDDRQALPPERLLREARALAKLNHPNVVAVHDAGTVRRDTLERSSDGDGLVFIAMEYVRGVTLRAWLRERHPPREVLSTMQAAGRGLAAAHAAGIVHRDFKPANVVLGEDGRVRVLDFGLARGFRGDINDIFIESRSDGPDTPAGPVAGRPSDDSHDQSLQATDAGLIVGTPRYMAPEQMTLSAIDARTDQFAFCVVLYEALYGRRPFGGESLRQRFDAIANGAPSDGDEVRGVGRRVRSAVLRGLAANPAERHASMDALLDTLDRGARPPTVALLAIGAVALTAGGVALGSLTTHAPGPCAGAAALLRPTWGPQRHDAIRAAFGRTELPFADDTAVRTIDVLDRYADQWVAMREEACAATRVRGDQSEDLMDLRMTCLDQRRQEVHALVDLLALGDPGAIENAVSAARGLPPLTPCADAQQLRASVPPPADPAVRAAVDALFTRVAAARALLLTGAYEQAAAAAQQVLDEARPTEHAAVIGRAALLAAGALDQTGNPDAALPLFVEGLAHVTEAGAVHEEAIALAALAQHMGLVRGDLQAALRYVAHGRGLLRRLGDPPDVALRLIVAEAASDLRAAKFEEGERLVLLGLAIETDDPAAPSLRAVLLNNLGAIYGVQGRYEQGDEIARQTLALTQSGLGPQHPTTAIAQMNVGVAAFKLGRPQEASDHYAAAESILSAAFPNGHAQLAGVLSNQAQLLRFSGDLRGARARYEAALAMKIRLLGEHDAAVGHTANNLGDLLLETGDIVDARRHAEQAMRIWDASIGPSHPTVAYAHITLGECDLADGKPIVALERFEHALTLWQDAGYAESQVGVVRFQIARALIRANQQLDRARTLAEGSLEIARKDTTVGPAELAEVERWLAER